MTKKNIENIYILSPTRGYIEPLGMVGPIVRPILVPKKSVIKLLMLGVEVHEYVPKTKYTIKLTLKNINDKTRYGVEPENSVLKTDNPVKPIEKTGVPIVRKETTISDREYVENINLNYNSDGTVIEAGIDWQGLTKNQRRELRIRINAINEKAKKTDDSIQ